MARVVLSGTLKQLAGGAAEIELEASDVRQLLRADGSSSAWAEEMWADTPAERVVLSPELHARLSGKDGAELVAVVEMPEDGVVRLAGSARPHGPVVVFDRPTKRLLGVHVLCDVASELVPLGQEIIGQHGTIDRFVDLTLAVPTYTLAYKLAAFDGLARLAAARAPVNGHASLGIAAMVP